MENLDQDISFDASNQLAPTREMRQNWYETASWAKFISIVGFIMAGIALLLVSSLTTIFAMLAQMGVDTPGLNLLNSLGTGMTIYMLVLVAVQVALNLFQYRFATRLKTAVQRTDQVAFEEAWLNFRNLFRWSGVFLIVLVVFYLVFSLYLLAVLLPTEGG
ncbi:MAG: hypothetical protein IPH12_08180 [Saprospirales bacterium]|jgi:hypothetical protein|nr:hypothetical protein [Saprospirales bacterium]MBK8920807.1 hypothetical protein [Saprospirales bacterium]